MEVLLYDFTANQGDTIWGAYGGLGQPLVVSFTDSVLVDGQQRKRVHLKLGPTWTEGIGSSFGLFRPDFIPLSLSWNLHCMSNDSVSFTPNGGGSYNVSPGKCSLTVGVNEITDQTSSFSVFPNPASDRLTIDATVKVKEVHLYNSIGMLVDTKTTNSFSVQELNSGVYFLKIHTEDNTFFHQFVKQ